MRRNKHKSKVDKNHRNSQYNRQTSVKCSSSDVSAAESTCCKVRLRVITFISTCWSWILNCWLWPARVCIRVSLATYRFLLSLRQAVMSGRSRENLQELCLCCHRKVTVNFNTDDGNLATNSSQESNCLENGDQPQIDKSSNRSNHINSEQRDDASKSLDHFTVTKDTKELIGESCTTELNDRPNDIVDGKHKTEISDECPPRTTVKQVAVRTEPNEPVNVVSVDSIQVSLLNSCVASVGHSTVLDASACRPMLTPVEKTTATRLAPDGCQPDHETKHLELNDAALSQPPNSDTNLNSASPLNGSSKQKASMEKGRNDSESRCSSKGKGKNGNVHDTKHGTASGRQQEPSDSSQQSALHLPAGAGVIKDSEKCSAGRNGSQKLEQATKTSNQSEPNTLTPVVRVPAGPSTNTNSHSSSSHLDGHESCLTLQNSSNKQSGTHTKKTRLSKTSQYQQQDKSSVSQTIPIVVDINIDELQNTGTNKKLQDNDLHDSPQIHSTCKLEPGHQPEHQPRQTGLQPPVEPPVVPPVAPPVKSPVEPLVESPVESPVEPPVKSPVEPPVKSPVEPHVESPVESPVEPPVKSPVEPPVEEVSARDRRGKDTSVMEPNEHNNDVSSDAAAVSGFVYDTESENVDGENSCLSKCLPTSSPVTVCTSSETGTTSPKLPVGKPAVAETTAGSSVSNWSSGEVNEPKKPENHQNLSSTSIEDSTVLRDNTSCLNIWKCKIPVGLENLGNTCYFNSVMQNINQTFLLEKELLKSVPTTPIGDQESNSKPVTADGCGRQEVSVTGIKKETCDLPESVNGSLSVVPQSSAETHNEDPSDDGMFQKAKKKFNRWFPKKIQKSTITSDPPPPSQQPAQLIQQTESQTLTRASTDSMPLTRSLRDFYKAIAEISNRSPPSRSPQISRPLQRLFGNLCAKSERFAGRRQQDSHECLRHLLDGIKEEAKAARTGLPVDNSTENDKLTVVDNIFGGHYLTVFDCAECKTPYHLFEPFLDVSLPIAFSEQKICDDWSEETKDNSSITSTSDESFHSAQNIAPLVDHSAASSTPTPPGNKNQKTKQYGQHQKRKKPRKEERKAQKRHRHSMPVLASSEVENKENQGKAAVYGETGNMVSPPVTPTEDLNTGKADQQNMKLERENQTAVSVPQEQTMTRSAEENENEFENKSGKQVKPELEKENQPSKMEVSEETKRSGKEVESQLENELRPANISELADTYDDYNKAIKDITKRLAPAGGTDPDSVLNSLRFFTRVEQLDEYLCLKCNECLSDAEEPKMTSGRKQTLIFNPPAVLTVHLKRFEQTPRGYRKVTKPIAFDLELNLAPFCSHLALRQAYKANRECLYSLYGVVVHGGTLKGGHYIAYVRVRSVDVEQSKVFLQKIFFDRDALMGKDELIDLVKELHSERHQWQLDQVPADSGVNSEHSQWYGISDRQVERVNRAEVLYQQAYLLFYERIHRHNCDNNSTIITSL